MAHRWKQEKKELGTGYYQYREVCEECGYAGGTVSTTCSRKDIVHEPNDLVFVTWEDAGGLPRYGRMTCDEYKIHSVMNL